MAKLAIGFVATALGLTLAHAAPGHAAHPTHAPLTIRAGAAAHR